VRSTLRPLFDQIVVKELAPPDQRRSGLLLPAEHHRHPPQEGIVVATGAGQDWWAHVGFEMPVKAGDHVMFPWQVGTYVELDEEQLLVLRVSMLLGVVEEVPDGAMPTAELHDELRDGPRDTSG
jgi:co-chaperonin GroES (HSP10)